MASALSHRAVFSKAMARSTIWTTGVGVLGATLATDRACVVALEQLHHEEGGPVLRHVIVEDGYRPGVLEGIGGIPFTKKARADVLADRELGVQHLDGKSLQVAVCGDVDDSHSTDPEDAVEAVLAFQGGPQNGARPRVQLAVLRHDPLGPVCGGASPPFKTP
jgi:hypothetical protein